MRTQQQLKTFKPMLERHCYGKRLALCFILFGMLSLQMPSHAQLGGLETYKNRKLGAAPEVIEAAHDGDLQKLRSLWQSDRNTLLARDSYLRTPLMVSAWAEKPRVMEFLLEKKVDVEAVDTHGNTALHFAALQGKVELIKMLLENQASINAQNYNGEAPIFFAIRSENFKAVEAFVMAGADTNVTDYTARNTNDYVRQIKDRKLQRKLHEILR